MTSQRLTLSDGSVVWVDAVAGDLEEEVAFRRGGGTPFAEVLPSVVSLCQDLGDALKSLAPQRTQVQFGVAFKAESTGLSALIAKGGVEANFVVTLEWSRDAADSPAADNAQPADPSAEPSVGPSAA